MIDTLLAGRYRLDARLGEGGMAVVYKAMDVVLNRVVAVKVLRDQYAGDDEFVERFRREAQAAASLSHPNVVNIFDVGHTDGVHFIVLEYVQGQNLKQILREEGRLEPRRAARIAAAVARALQSAHDRGLVHRDVKPHNILITPEGRVKVTDFGIARASSAATLTETGMVVGSVHYFSPEQARGRAVGPAADVYSLGVVLYEMLTGGVPFRGESPVAVALQHLQQEPTAPRELVRSVPRWLDGVVMQALEKDPAKRFRSAAQMAAELAWRHDAPAVEEDVYARVAGNETVLQGAATGRAAEGFGTRRGAAPARGAEPRGFDPSARPPRVYLEDGFEDRPEGEDAATREEEPEEARPRPRWRGWAIAVVLLVLIGFGVSAGTPLLLGLIFPPEVDVPEVVGLTYDEALPLAQAAGLLLRVDAEVFDQEIPEGFIARQSPDGGRTVRKGREVAVVLSRGPEMALLPDVTGMPVRDARVRLTQEGFTLAGEEPMEGVDAPANEVVAQEPAPNTSLKKGTPVTLWVSKPGVGVASRVELPDFRGEPLQEVEAVLKNLGLVPGNRWAERHPLVASGRIIDQNPPPGATVEAGAIVDFVYSIGAGAGAGAGPTPPPSGPPQEPAPQQEPPQTTASAEDDAFAAEFGVDAERREEEDRTEVAETKSPPEGPGTAADEHSGVDWDAVLRAESGEDGRRRARVEVTIPPGSAKEIVILVIDDFGVREAFRETVVGGGAVERLVEGRGENARLQVYVDGVMQTDEPFPKF